MWRAKNYGKKFPELSQTSFRGQKNTEKSGVRLNFDASSVLRPTSARSKTRSSPEYSTSENQFSEVFHSEFSVLICSIPKTENSKLKTSEFSLRFTRTRISFTKLCNFTHFDQTPSFFNSEVSFLRYTPNRKLGDGKPQSLI